MATIREKHHLHHEQQGIRIHFHKGNGKSGKGCVRQEGTYPFHRIRTF